MKERLMIAVIALGIGLLVFGGGYGVWRFNRWFHYSFGYESQVEDTVRSLVKPECLK